jgi:hypothetical protein
MKKVLIIAMAIVAPLFAFSQDFSAKSEVISVDISPGAPVVTWLNPIKENLVSKQKTMALKLSVQSPSPISEVRILQNGQDVRMSRGIGISNSGSQEIVEQQVNLVEGKNEFEITILNEEGGEATVSRTISYNFDIIERNDYALIFAINEYDEWNDLSNPVFDAEAVKEELESYYGFKVELILNPKRITILEKIREYAAKTYLPKDQLLVFFAGHGKFDEITKMGYLAAQDSRLDDIVSDSYISHSALRDYINNIPCEHTLVLLDACFGGTFDQQIARAGSRGQNQFFELTKTEFIQRKLKYKTRKYLTSGGKEYVPDGTPGAHSPFARKFLEALRNYGGSDQILTYTELMTYFEALVPQPRSGEFGDNAPGSDFIFVAN